MSWSYSDLRISKEDYVLNGFSPFLVLYKPKITFSKNYSVSIWRLFCVTFEAENFFRQTFLIELIEGVVFYLSNDLYSRIIIHLGSETHGHKLCWILKPSDSSNCVSWLYNFTTFYSIKCKISFSFLRNSFPTFIRLSFTS